MSLIDSTYFKADINIPTRTYDNLSTFITKFEKQFLIRVFGYTLYKLIAAYSAESPVDTAQRIRDIIEGKEFTSGDFTYKWNGLINDDKISPIAYYVYHYYAKDQIAKMTTTGEVQNEQDNAIVVLSNKMVYAWQSMCQLIGNAGEYTYDSLYYFMLKNYSDYPDWQYKGFEPINSFGI